MWGRREDQAKLLTDVTGTGWEAMVISCTPWKFLFDIWKTQARIIEQAICQRSSDKSGSVQNLTRQCFSHLLYLSLFSKWAEPDSLQRSLPFCIVLWRFTQHSPYLWFSWKHLFSVTPQIVCWCVCVHAVKLIFYSYYRKYYSAMVITFQLTRKTEQRRFPRKQNMGW